MAKDDALLLVEETLKLWQKRASGWTVENSQDVPIIRREDGEQMMDEALAAISAARGGK